MKPSDSTLDQKVRQWVKLAEEDLRLAKHGLKLTSSVPYRLIAYHAQQCAEKYLKAYLVSHLVDFPFTHNIGYLIELCAEKTSWQPELKDADTLTVFATTTRYPGLSDRVTKKDVLEALTIAVQLRNAVKKRLKDEKNNKIKGKVPV